MANPRRCSICSAVGHVRTKCKDLRAIEFELAEALRSFDASWNAGLVVEGPRDWRVRNLRRALKKLQHRIDLGAR